MTTADLAQLVWSEPGLQETVRHITVASAGSEIENVKLQPFTEDIDWFHLLRCAAIFLESEEDFLHEIALRIVHSCLILAATMDVRAFAASILAKVASNPSINVAINRSLLPEDILERLPFSLSLEVMAHQIASTVNIGNTHEFIGNEFQNSLWHALTEYDWVSASAPTSAGKSFVLKKWIEHAVRTLSSSTTFFIVPTRALISQVENDLRSMLVKESSDINITSLPLAFNEPARHNIYIYTQERFHLYLLKQAQVNKVDLIIIDEAQQIGANRRGVLLQQVLELASRRFPSAKVLFASPSTDNPQSLLEFAPTGKRIKVISGAKPTVNQNLIWVEQVPRQPTHWKLRLMTDGDALFIGDVTLQNRPMTSQKMPFIAQMIGGNVGGNVIYVNRAADAEKVAEILCQFVQHESDDTELVALSELCEKAVHRKFVLRRFVKKGVAFHYGNMPQLIRTEVERLFSAGKIKFLVCTSTLIEGVNLSCRNIFMRNPKRGMRDLMTPEDFWNLAGRAGRWGKEFQGNIYCIDPLKTNEWYNGSAPRKKQKNTIRIATQRLANEFSEFITYVRDRAPKLETTDRFYEHLLSYLIFHQSEYGDLVSSPSMKSLTEAQVSEVFGIIKETIDNLGIPVEIVLRNPGINPWGMKKLYDYFHSKPDDELEELLPADPLSDAPLPKEEDENKDVAIANFIAIFSRITDYLEGNLGSGANAYGNALLVIHWMRGYPLSRIIDRQIRYWSKRGKSDTAIIRETMERVEKIARFETPKYLHAYLDVLLLVLKGKGRDDLIPSTDDFWLYLEFGVSKRTQLSLMALGLSRSSVTALSEYITEDNMSETSCLDWLVTNSWKEFGLPRLVELEITTVLQRHGHTD